MRPVEDGLILERDALLAQLEQPLGDELGLLVHVAQRHQGGQHACLAVRGELLGKLLLVVADRGIREREDLRRRAVVDRQLVLLAPGPPLGELEDVLEVRAAEPVDALRVVADHQEVLVLLGHRVDDVAL